MKKLMIAAASAVMVGSAFAVNKAQVYDFSASLKTTACKAGKVSAALEKYFNHTNIGLSMFAGQYSKGDEIGVRKQVSVKLAGVIWGCDCPTISMPAWRPYGATTVNPARYLGGYLFWNQQNEELYNPFLTAFDWPVLNRIDTMTKVEGAFRLRCSQVGQTLYMFGAGFGSAKGTGCDTYVSSINGNLAGFRVAPLDEFGCLFCAATGCTVTPLCDTCRDRNTTTLTVSSGTWKIKYNSSASKKLSAGGFLSSAYSFKKAGATKAILNWIEKFYYANPIEDADEATPLEEVGLYDEITPAEAGDSRVWKHADTDEYNLEDLIDPDDFAEAILEAIDPAKWDALPNWVTQGTEEDEEFVELIADLS